MLIDLVCPYSFDVPGGVQRQVVLLAKAYAKLGHGVRIWGISKRRLSNIEGIEEDLLITESPDAGEISYVHLGPSISFKSNGSVAPIGLHPSSMVKAFYELVSLKSDVTHIHEPLVPGPPLESLLMAKSKKKVCTFHRMGVDPLYKVEGRLFGHFLKESHLLAAVSESAKETIFEIAGVEAQVAFNGVDLERFGRIGGEIPDSISKRPDFSPGSEYVLFIGRHEKRKGLQILIESYLELLGNPEISLPELWISGLGPLTKDLEEQFGKVKGIKFIGMLPMDDLITVLKGAKLLVAPSLGGESFGLVLIEAMACSTPVICSDIPGYREVMDYPEALFKPNDPKDLGRVMVQYLVNEAKRLELKANCTRRAQQFGIMELAKWYEDRFE
ncbi:MAG: glycosyltransferase family 4 protein [Acidimicrobiales bacterium]|nr:glycosyltransferase family 4 protein [Acidimicrobiales bacterium]